jgi:hypothetical protein
VLIAADKSQSFSRTRLMRFTRIFLTLILLTNSKLALAQYSRPDCQSEINRMREIYIVILRKIPAMPPLAQLSQGIVRALNDAESSRDAENYNQCVVQMRKQIQIVEGYAR